MHRAKALGVYQAIALRDDEQRKLAQKHLNVRQLIRKACDVRKPYPIEWRNGIPVSFQQQCQYQCDNGSQSKSTGKSDSEDHGDGDGAETITHPMLMPDYSKPRFKRPANDKEHPLDQFRSLGWDAFQVIVKADMEQRIEELER